MRKKGLAFSRNVLGCKMHAKFDKCFLVMFAWCNSMNNIFSQYVLDPFIQDKCCHLTLYLHLMEPHFNVRILYAGNLHIFTESMATFNNYNSFLVISIKTPRCIFKETSRPLSWTQLGSKHNFSWQLSSQMRGGC